MNKKKHPHTAHETSNYDHMMGTPMSPQDHPANNVIHPSGNRNAEHATLPPLSAPMNAPMGSMNEDYD